MIIFEDGIVMDTHKRTITLSEQEKEKVEINFQPIKEEDEDEYLKALCQNILLEIPSKYWITSYKTVIVMWGMYVHKMETIEPEYLSVVTEKVTRACLDHFKENPVFK